MAIYSKYPLKVLQEVAPFPPIQNTANPYLTQAAMYADQANQLQGYGYLVDGVGAFTYLGTLAGTAADYESLSSNKKLDKQIISGAGVDKSDALRIINPEGGMARHYYTNQPGAIKITFPVNITHSATFAIDVEIFGRQYSTNPVDSAKIHISGQTNSASVDHTSVTTLVSDNGLDYPVRFGNDGTNFCIWIAETTHVFDYVTTAISNLYVGRLNSGTFADWDAPFDISRTTTFGTVQLLMENNLPIADFNKLENKPVGVSGSFTSSDSKTVTVTDGIIISIV